MAERKSIVRPERGIINHTFTLVAEGFYSRLILVEAVAWLPVNDVKRQLLFRPLFAQQCALPLIRTSFEISSRYSLLPTRRLFCNQKREERKGRKRRKMNHLHQEILNVILISEQDNSTEFYRPKINSFSVIFLYSNFSFPLHCISSIFQISRVFDSSFFFFLRISTLKSESANLTARHSLEN